MYNIYIDIISNIDRPYMNIDIAVTKFLKGEEY